MYTRCPHCTTTFRLNAAQLKAHAGQVRCGRCQQVFQADQQLVEKPARKPATARKKSARKPRAREAPPAAAGPAESTALETGAESAGEPIRPEDIPPPPPLMRAPRVRTSVLAWTAGSALLGVGLVVQGLVFYGADLVRWEPALSSTVSTL